MMDAIVDPPPLNDPDFTGYEWLGEPDKEYILAYLKDQDVATSDGLDTFHRGESAAASVGSDDGQALRQGPSGVSTDAAVAAKVE
jgi:hypothetical protein